MSEAISFILGMIAMAVVWFINDNSPDTSPYARGYVEGYKDAMKKYKKSEGDGMSILIKKMEMPKGCWACPFAVGKHYECLFTKKSYNWGLTTRPSDCPLIEIQSPHGRLIDGNQLETIMANAIEMCTTVAEALECKDDPEIKMEIKAYTDILNGVKEQLTIIEAEGSDT